ncbi:Fur family transcriptional regulator [Eremococcus coleocola]|uniref:Transcriptional regulator, Fur family n=1 Tax=Eremococcus coleocola ACS-139-V-Col8 TaxID=908337 RepID=E4KM32_9LACT|nr:Fur family transcriptional regulator [Eremococcus coleocola]EFR32007.1 transcriptional regulator, Fur family [Eremococcus coleocola ACS-139-V-Col8]
MESKTHHHNHSTTLCPEERLDQSLETLKEKGFKLTNKRREILEIFIDSDRYLTAKQVYQSLAEKYPTMSYNTTYRNLYDFVKIGLLESTEYQNEQLFRISCEGEDHHHHHFICTNCGKTIPLEICPMDHIQTDLSQVEVQMHRFEVFGLCADCKAKQEA